MTDKRSESQWKKLSQSIENYENTYGVPEGVDWRWTAESQNEQAEEEERERTKIPYMSRNAEDIENSKRSRGERL